MKKDWCTASPENWVQWYIGKYYIPMLRKVYIGDCCELHDNTCSTSKFLKCLWKKRILGAMLITLGGYAGCVPQKIYKWVKGKYNEYKRCR